MDDQEANIGSSRRRNFAAAMEGQPSDPGSLAASLGSPNPFGGNMMGQESLSPEPNEKVGPSDLRKAKTLKVSS